MFRAAREMFSKWLPFSTPCYTNNKDFFGCASPSPESTQRTISNNQLHKSSEEKKRIRKEERSQARASAKVVAEQAKLVESLTKQKQGQDESKRFIHLSSAANAIALLTGLQPANPALLDLKKAASEDRDIRSLVSDLGFEPAETCGYEAEPAETCGYEADDEAGEISHLPRLLKQSHSANSLIISPLTLTSASSSTSLASHPTDAYRTEILARSASFHGDFRATSPAMMTDEEPELSMVISPFP